MHVIADQQIPFSIKAPNQETRTAMTEAEEISMARAHGFIDEIEQSSSLEKTLIIRKGESSRPL